MKLTLYDIITVEGSELECAVFTHAFLEVFRMKGEFDRKKEEEAWLKKYGNMSIGEIMKREREEEE